ncbi:uncharacterized protein V6R79_011285 [Siganus canaliculatus]
MKQELDAMRAEIAKEFGKQLTELKDEVKQMREERINDLKEQLKRAEDKLDIAARDLAEEREKECVIQ